MNAKFSISISDNKKDNVVLHCPFFLLYYTMTPDEIFKLSDQEWIHLIKTQEIQMDTLTCFASHIPDKAWNRLAVYQKLTEKFILDFHYKFDIPTLLTGQVIHEKTIRENLDIFQDHMWHACRYQYLTEEFIQDHDKIVNWKQLFLHQKHLSLSFILKHFSKRFPRREFIYDPLDVFHMETYYQHPGPIGRIVKIHNNKIRKVTAAGKARFRK